ncbi:MAG: TIGR02266 family protein [Polyangiaceae bacterium]|jgi:type IV pilus assembly protein PilZ
MATINKDLQGAVLSASRVDDADTDEESPSRRDERRVHDRFDVEWAVDCIADDTFLYAAITNISAMGIFVKTTDPLAIGTRLMLAFSPPGYPPFKLQGEVAWINALRPNGDNPNPGMGVRFVDLRPDNRERLVEVIRTIAYVREPA